jgi:hypothetical protein
MFVAAAAPIAARVGAATAVRPDLSVLLVGGAADPGAAATEVYAAGAFAPLDLAIPASLSEHAVATLGDGRVLVTGGRETPGGPPVGTTYVIAPEGLVAGVLPLFHARARHTLTISSTDTFSPAFVVGGRDDVGPRADIELFDPDAAAFTAITSQLAQARYDHTTTLLQHGRLLIVGGIGGDGAPLATAELFDPITRTVRPAGKLAVPRSGHTATLLASGRVLIAGGLDDQRNATASAEVYDPDLGPTGGFVPTASLRNARAGHAAAPLCDASVFFVGGGAPAAEVYNPTP